MKLGKLSGLASALRHVPPRAIILRLRREWRQRKLVYPQNSRRLFEATTPEDATELASVVTRLSNRDFLAFAAKTRELAASAFSYDSTEDALTFTLSGDILTVVDVDKIAWTDPARISTSDFNRCYFISFVEQAALLDSVPEIDLVRLDAFVDSLIRAAPLGAGRLTIPWQPLPAARRLVNVVAGLSSILARDPALAQRPEVARLVAHVALLREIVALIREDDLGYNHLASEIFAQCVADRLFDDRTALEQHARELVGTMTAQVGADGMQLERSATYQAHLLGHLDALIAGKVLPDPYHTRIVHLATTMRMALGLMTHRDGNIAVFNDAAIGDGPSPTVLGATSRPIGTGIHLLPIAGYARLEHGAFSALFDAGPCGADDNPGHAHADFLSFELDVGQARLFVDPGVASYKAGAERDACRSAAQHNGPTFLGLEPIEFLGPFRIGRRGRGRFFEPLIAAALNMIVPGIGGTHDGFTRAGGQVARWLATPCEDAILVVDAWRGLADRDARSSFLIEGGGWLNETTSPTRIVLLHRATRERVVIAALSGTFAIEEGLHYHPYGPKRSFPALRVSLTPDPAVGMLRSTALAVLRGEQAGSDFSQEASKLTKVLLARALDG